MIIWNFLCVRIIDLLHIRNLGIRSADEIMTALMEYQFSLLSDEGKKKYLARIDELNAKDDK